MPKYRTETGVVVDVPEQKAERVGGLTPVDAPASARRGPGGKKAGHIKPLAAGGATTPSNVEPAR